VGSDGSTAYRLITNCGGLSQINEAVHAIERGEVVKAVLSIA
jgi:Zn-dependent alcohol dehydrogenase